MPLLLARKFTFIGIFQSFEKLTYSQMGRSRSAAVVLAYLMKTSYLTYSEARELVQEIRPGININPGFVQQLQIWDIIKHNWENRAAYAEYRYWKMAHNAALVARTLTVTSNPTDYRKSM